MPLLEVSHLWKRFGGVIAVNDVSLCLHQGEIRGLIGPNGSGKTTLVNLLAGFYLPDAGTIRLRGEIITRLRPDQRLARGLMRTFQIPKLFDDMSVLENLLVPALSDSQYQRPSLGTIHRRAEEALAFCRLAHLRHALAKTLSGGQKMLLQLMRGFMVDPLYLYIMDEPFTGIHPALKELMIDAIMKLNAERGITFLIISHEMPTIRKLCGIIDVMHAGRLIAEGSLTEVANDPWVLEAYLGARDVLTAD